ncbi:tigger transposable element-derived protein 4-like [Leptopilina heterotoma]|uniref:tigger transposable element-derived protein 4-like n=1 Tax=Leptopilina heterotoma TaxID=63436 RepID=UPI001CA9AFE3|nr:tigger transposable element-derived protein 4-like [Leptopilina heterotoma]
MSTPKRKALSLQEKAKILKLYGEKSQTQSQTNLAIEFDLPVFTLRTILKSRNEIEEECRSGGAKRKKLKTGKFEKLEGVLVDWFHQARALKIPISGPILCEKAREIAAGLQITDFTGSTGWLDRFKNRHGIVYRQINGESESVSEQDVDTWKTMLPAMLQNYEPRDIFNADEFGLFFKLMPNKSHVFKGETCHGGKASKERLTGLACSNSDGSEKLRLLVIGNSKKPRCFKNVKSLPVEYDAQSRAWMTGPRFIKWIKALDDHFQSKSRQIILFIDNCPAHPKDVELTNIKLVFLPPNATSKLQPMYQGIIKVVKQGFRSNDYVIIEEESEPNILPDFPEYSSIDDDVLTYEVSSLQDLVDDAKNMEEVPENDDDDEDEPIPILSNSQALTADFYIKKTSMDFAILITGHFFVERDYAAYGTIAFWESLPCVIYCS